jgi:hypothetical protein
MRSERHLVLAKLALGASLGGVVLFIVVAIMAIASPTTWTMTDAANAMLAAEVGAFFLGSLAYRTGIGMSAMVISGVLALGCFLSSR